MRFSTSLFFLTAAMIFLGKQSYAEQRSVLPSGKIFLIDDRGQVSLNETAGKNEGAKFALIDPSQIYASVVSNAVETKEGLVNFFVASLRNQKYVLRLYQLTDSKLSDDFSTELEDRSNRLEPNSIQGLRAGQFKDGRLVVVVDQTAYHRHPLSTLLLLEADGRYFKSFNIDIGVTKLFVHQVGANEYLRIVGPATYNSNDVDRREDIAVWTFMSSEAIHVHKEVFDSISDASLSGVLPSGDLVLYYHKGNFSGSKLVAISPTGQWSRKDCSMEEADSLEILKDGRVKLSSSQSKESLITPVPTKN